VGNRARTFPSERAINIPSCSAPSRRSAPITSAACCAARRSRKRACGDQLCLSPQQYGFASTEDGNMLTEDEQWRKLAMIVEIAGQVWG
jgi:hypothetical protein